MPKQTDKWDKFVHLGTGPTTAEGKFEVNESGVGSYTGVGFRGDSRDPQKLFASGFKVNTSGGLVSRRKPSRIPSLNTEQGLTRGVVSSSQELYFASLYGAGAKGGGYVYLIAKKADPLTGSLEANAGDSKALQETAMKQKELLSMEVKPEEIVAARRVENINGKPTFTQAPEFNPKFKGDVLNDFDITEGQLGMFFDRDLETIPRPDEQVHEQNLEKIEKPDESTFDDDEAPSPATPSSR